MDSRADTPDSGENSGSPDAWTSLMSSQNGLDCIIENPDLVHRFAAGEYGVIRVFGGRFGGGRLGC